jgi:hypothetical protein
MKYTYRVGVNMSLALLAIKLQIFLNAIILALVFGLAVLSTFNVAGTVLGLLIQLIILVILFLFINRESKLAASIYIVFAFLTYLRIISMDFTLATIPAILDAILSLIASYGIFSWWRNKSVAS